MISRRRFIAQSAAFSLVCGAVPVSPYQRNELLTTTPKDQEIKITILHTNDTHSQIEPLPDRDPLFPGKGGVARRATLIKQVREENPNLLVIDAGDVFQGTPYFNFYKGEVEYRAMSEIGYDAGTLGNHEFDNGVDALVAAMKFARFEFVSANYDVRGTALEQRVKPYIVRNIGGIRVGLFGLGISPVGLITPANFKGVTYRDPVAAARQVVTQLREVEKCELVVGMSHLGYYPNPEPNQVGDSQVASQVDGIDFIAGGHTHTFMQTPVRVKQPSGKETLLFQVGKSGIYVGRVDFLVKSNQIVASNGSLLDLRDVSHPR